MTRVTIWEDIKGEISEKERRQENWERLVKLTREYTALNWRATTEEIAEVTRPLNKVKKELGFNKLLEKEWEKLRVYTQSIHDYKDSNREVPTELLELENKQIAYLRKLIDDRQIVLDLKNHYRAILEKGEDIILTKIDEKRLSVLKELNIKNFIVEDKSSGLMENLHKLKALGEVGIELHIREVKSDWRDKVHKIQGIKVTIK